MQNECKCNIYKRRHTRDEHEQWMANHLVRTKATAHDLQLGDGPRKRASPGGDQSQSDDDSEGIRFNGFGYVSGDDEGDNESATMSWSEEDEEEHNDGEEGASHELEIDDDDLAWITGKREQWKSANPGGV